jgi:chemotaxis protein MotA
MALVASVRGYAPPVAVEFARKLLFAEDRPTFGELEAQLKGKPVPGGTGPGKPKAA